MFALIGKKIITILRIKICFCRPMESAYLHIGLHELYITIPKIIMILGEISYLFAFKIIKFHASVVLC